MQTINSEHLLITDTSTRPDGVHYREVSLYIKCIYPRDLTIEETTRSEAKAP